jgi:hypothetical protein
MGVAIKRVAGADGVHIVKFKTDILPEADWIYHSRPMFNASIDALLTAAVIPLHWKPTGVGDEVREWTQEEKDALASQREAARLRGAVMSVTDPPSVVGPYTVSAVGLIVTTTVNNLILNDVTNLTANTVDAKRILFSLVYDQTADAFSISARQRKTTSVPPEIYAPLAADAFNMGNLKEFDLAANGITLTEVT